MACRSLTELVKMLSKSGDSNFCNNSSDNEIDDITVVDAIKKDDSDKEEEISKMFLWVTKDNYSGHKGLFCVDRGPINEAKNVGNMLEYLEIFFYTAIE